MKPALSSTPTSPATQPHRQAPGPTSARMTTQAMERNPLQFLLEMTRQYGDVVRLPLTFGTTYLINHPDGIRYVLQEHAANYGKDPHENNIFKRFVGESILTTEGEVWRRLRRLEQPAFQRRHIALAGAQMVAATQAFLDEWQEQAAQGALVDLVPAMQALALRVLGKTIFSLDLSEASSSVAEALQAINVYALALFYRPWLPYLGPLAATNRRGSAALHTLYDLVSRLIRERRAQFHAPHCQIPDAAPGAAGHSLSSSAPEDILTLFLLLRDEHGQPAFTDEQISNETLSLLIAGHDNASSLLCWTWYLLAQHPDIARRVYSEVEEVLQGRPPTLDDLSRLPYIRMVLEEVLRLYPPAWSFPRRALADDTIAGYTIPAGSTILLCPYTTHRHPAVWRDPETFDPERFSETEQTQRPRYAHFPFGGGQHQCMGAIYAMTEAHLIIAMTAQRYRLELVPGFSVHPEPLVTLRPRELPMQLRPVL